jgi:uncharacterized sulfatase
LFSYFTGFAGSPFHQPYTIPEKYKGKFKKGPLPIHQAISYPDHSLKAFFTQIKNLPWYQNTLFVLTADHTQERFEPSFSDMYGSYDVPLIFYCPSLKLKADTGRWIQHLDIGPSILDLLDGPQKRYNLLGRSIFQKENGFPIQYQDGTYFLFHPDGILGWKGNDPQSDWTWDSVKKLPEPKPFRKLLVSRIQYYRQGLIHNQLFR